MNFIKTCVFGALFLSLTACNSGTVGPTAVVNNLVSAVSDADTMPDQVSENAVNGDTVGVTGSAQDVDAGDSVTFSLHIDAAGRFTIDAVTGVVTVADDTRLDFEDIESHTIGITATSSDGSSTATTYTITLLDETFTNGGDNDMMIMVEAGDDFEQKLQETLITAPSESIIMLPQGTFMMTGELSTSIDNLIIRGHGMGADTGTVLNFGNQTSGSQGILVTGDNFVIEDVALEDSPGDLLKIMGTDGVIIRRVRAEWTNGPDSENGAYGLYPVQTRNVLIEDTEVRGASDAGVYVGQSEQIIVRRNFVYENVAGIEIENSKFADVYDNETTLNTGGILVFDLPGSPIQGGQGTRVFNNRVYDNNTPNFAPEGNIVGEVPGGTGIMILANDDIEVFNNEITNNGSAAILIVSFYFSDASVSNPSYDPVPERIHIHDNVLTDNAQAPQDLAAVIAGFVFGGNAIDIIYDSSGVGTDGGLLLEFPDGLTEDQRICIRDNGNDTTFGTLNATVLLGAISGFPAAISQDPAPFVCSHPSLPEITLDPLVPGVSTVDNVDTAALCGASSSGINAAAFEADCPNLSSFRLFADQADPTQNANGGGVLYDLSTPLFSDYTIKDRFVFLPDGTQAVYRNEEVFDFPVGTIISKTFSVQSDLANPDSARELIETRLLIHRQGGWVALPYIWNSNKSDAVLTITGGTQTISWFDINGIMQSTDYAIPNTNNCANCHGDDDLIPIGPKAIYLNSDLDRGDGGALNQIENWANAGLLIDVPANSADIPIAPYFLDAAANLMDRARAYLDINCAHCHSETGAAGTTGLYLEYTRPFGREVGECKAPVAAGRGSGGLDYDIVPGDASQSIMTFRMDSNETDIAMPELARSVIHTEGVELIKDWINAMPANDCGG